jgi:hypothetical protein
LRCCKFRGFLTPRKKAFGFQNLSRQLTITVNTPTFHLPSDCTFSITISDLPGNEHGQSKQPPGEPMTLGNMRQLGVQRLVAYCLNPSCGHE